MLQRLGARKTDSTHTQDDRRSRAGTRPRPPRTQLRGGDASAGAQGVGHAGRSRRAMALSGLAAALVALCALVLGPLGALTAQAAPDTIGVRVEKTYQANHFDYLFKSTTDQYIYCANELLPYPHADRTLTPWKHGSAELDYLLYYGPGGPGYKGEFFGATGDEAYMAAQVAIWIAQGTPRSAHTSNPPVSETAAASGEKAYAAAKAAGKGIWTDCSLLYKADDATQPMAMCVPVRGTLSLHKANAAPGISDGLGTYTLEKATYGVYSDAACTSKVGELTCGASGDSGEIILPAGNYWVRELSASAGYAVDMQAHETTVVATKSTKVEVSEIPQVNKLNVLLRKVDRESGAENPLGSASLAGAQYTVRYFDGYYSADNLPGQATRTWTVVTGADGVADISTISGDPRYLDDAGEAVCPLGTVAIQETKAPRGYLLGTPPVHVVQVTPQGTGVFVDTYVAPEDPEQVVRGDIKLSKHDDDGTGASMAGVAFLVTSKTTGEAHVMVADDNGMLDTAARWNAHTYRTNANDAALVKTDDGYTVDETKLDPEAGIWFGQTSSGAATQPDDTLGALPYDRIKDGGGYTIEELATSASAGHDLVSTTVSISRDGVDLDLGTFDDDAVSIHTTAAADGSHEAPAAEGQVVTDTIHYENLTPGNTYTVRGRLMGFVAGNDEPMELATAETEFTAKKADGSLKLAFPAVDLTDYAGGRVVAYETLLEKGHELVTHENPDDVDQTVYVPVIQTKAAGKSGERVALAGNDTTVTDTIHYENLQPETSYTATATLHRLGETPLGNIDAGTVGNTATVTFTTPAAPDGEGAVSGDVDVPITSYLTDNAGNDVVIYEEVSRKGGPVVARHEDLNATSQTIQLPEIHTELTGKEGNHKVEATTHLTLTDSVEYANLVPDVEYRLCGTLHKVSPDGSDEGVVATAEATLTPEKADGTANVTFELDTAGLDLNDTYLVAFEELSLNGDVVAKHADLKDAAQTVAVGSLPAPPPAALPQTSDLVLPFSSLAVSGALATFIAIRLCRGGSAPRHVRKH